MLMKTWLILSNVLPNTQIRYAGDYVRIICAMCNAFRPPRIAQSYEAQLRAERMLALATQPNHLQELIEQRKWDKKRVIYATAMEVTFHNCNCKTGCVHLPSTIFLHRRMVYFPYLTSLSLAWRSFQILHLACISSSKLIHTQTSTWVTLVCTCFTSSKKSQIF